MKAKLRSLLPKRRGKKKASSTQGGSKLLDGVTVGVVEPSPTGDTLNDTDHEDDAVSPVDTSIETTLDSLPDLLSNSNGKLRLGAERTVVFHSTNLGIQLTRGTDGHVRVQSLTPTADSPTTADPTMQGTIRTGDVVLEMAGMDLRRPIDATAWSRAVSKVKRGTARPVTFVVAEERHNAAISRGANSTNGKKTTTVPTLQIEVDLADAASTSMDLRTSDTWEMEQSKAEWVEAEKRQQLEEEKARLLLGGGKPGRGQRRQHRDGDRRAPEDAGRGRQCRRRYVRRCGSRDAAGGEEGRGD